MINTFGLVGKHTVATGRGGNYFAKKIISERSIIILPALVVNRVQIEGLPHIRQK